MSKSVATTNHRFFAPVGRGFRVAASVLAALMAYAALPAFADDKDFEKAVEAYEEKDYETSLKRFKKAAEKGIPEAMFNVGVFYANGYGVQKDEAEAFKWMLKAAESGDVKAQYLVSCFYESGEGGAEKKDEDEAYKWMKKAAENKYPDAVCAVGRAYRTGTREKKDLEKAIALFNEAIDLGCADACLELGLMYQNGEGGLKSDEKKEFSLFKKGADGGNPDAAFQLAEYYVQDKGVSGSASRSYTFKMLKEKATPLYKKAADAGNIQAKLRYYLCDSKKENEKYLEDAARFGGPEEYFAYYFEIHKFSRGVSESSFESNALFKKVMESEDASPRYFYWIGVLYNYVVNEPKKADKWFTKAAEKGYAPAQDYLGQKYEFGGVLWRQVPVTLSDGDVGYIHRTCGCEKNAEEAAKWYTKAAEQGYLPAQYHLARCYEKGVGVEESDEEAIKLYRKTIEAHWNLLPNQSFYFLAPNHGPFNISDLKADAAFKLGRYYEKGWGVEKNLNEAIRWYKRSSEEREFYDDGLIGDIEAKEALKRLGVNK